MVHLHGDEFKTRIGAVQFSILATPSNDTDFPTLFERTSQILEVHAYGQRLVSFNNKNRLYWDGTYFDIDRENIHTLSDEEIKEWGKIVNWIASTLRSVKSEQISCIQLICLLVETPVYPQFLSGTFSLE